jgi:hypothetical protein
MIASSKCYALTMGDNTILFFKAFCTTQGMLHQLTIPYTLKQINGILGCKN